MPRRTIPRPQSLDKNDPFGAALSVDEFIGAPQQRGQWHIESFEVDEQAAITQALRMQVGDSPDRGVPEGRYIYLWHETLMEHMATGKPGPTTMMSNTPDEISDHADPFVHATGDVLIHGLGLSCVVSGLLTKPDVTHIDVVDLSEEIIDMVAPAYAEEPRVTIHQGNALEFPWPEGKRWNYVWHDIWAKISDGNLDPGHAENGVTYWDLFDLFRDRCDRQDAWAFHRALQMEECGKLADERMREFQRRWYEGTPDSRRELIIEYHQSANRGFETPREAIMALFEQQGKWEQLGERLNDPRPMHFLFEDHLFFDQVKEYFGPEIARQYIDGDLSYTPYERNPFEYDEDRKRFEEFLAAQEAKAA